MSILRVDGLVTRFELARGAFDVVDGVSLEIAPRETVALVGESGAGKSLTLRSIMHALPPHASIVGGTIAYDGRDFTRPSRRELRQVRGREIGVILQDPIAALNPVLPIGAQLGETLKQTKGVRGGRERHRQAVELLRLVGVPEPDRRLRSYPHELSGGMAQRVVIALALIGEPRLLLADEPTNALDVTVQAQILRLLVVLQKRLDMAIMLVTHDLGVVAQTCERVYVMYAGRVVEEAQTRALFASPRHPYTAALLSAVPSLESAGTEHVLPTIPGAPPDLAAPPPGCRFNPRCPLSEQACLEADVELVPTAHGGLSACRRHQIVTPVAAVASR